MLLADKPAVRQSPLLFSLVPHARGRHHDFMMRHLLSLLVLGFLAGSAPARKPSVLFLLTDDQRADCLGCMGHPQLRTPNIDRLAKEGVTFDSAFAQCAICCVSRASFMTGRIARHHPVGDFATPLGPELLAKTFPAVLKKQGYRTACLGKWGIGGPSPLKVFDTWQATGGQGQYFENVGGKRLHNSEVLGRRADQFLRGLKEDEAFCLVVCYKSPHEPFLPDPADAALFRDVKFPLPKTYTGDDFNRFPEFIRKSEGRSRLLKRHPTPEKYQEFVRVYLRLLAGVDRSVGRIHKTLDELKRDDDTIIVFASDHGFYLGEHGLSGKWLMHEESIRIPLIVRDPRLPAARKGKRNKDLVLNVDVAPTLLDLAGVAVPEGTDGKSLRPLLEGKKAAWRDHFFYEHHFHHGGRIPRTEGIRTKDTKYITYFDVKPAFEELYDLKTDPHETKNLVGNPAAKETLERMRRLYREEVRRLPPPVLPGGKKPTPK
jgi:arylsulfatase A-like enzyme